MHTIYINLHNLKTTLIFSTEISRDYSSRHGLRMCRGGLRMGNSPPPPPTPRL